MTAKPVLTDDSVSVVVPTFQRSSELLQALHSVAKQSLENSRVHLIVVDNNPTPQERGAVQSIIPLFCNPVHYIHVPRAGLSNARNGAMAAVKTRYLAFLDDDMTASPEWLEALIATSRQLDAGIVFGPIHAVLPDANDPYADYMSAFFSRRLSLTDDALIGDSMGAGGSLLDLTLCSLPDPMFDPDLNHRGGEDDILFDRLKRSGTRVAWSPRAVSQEIVPSHRATPAYIRDRSFGFGQGPTRICANRGIRGLPGILYFMTTGTIQIGLYGPQYLWAQFRKNPSSIKFLSLLSQGLGKILWGDRFSLNLYGRTPSLPETPLPATNSLAE